VNIRKTTQRNVLANLNQ